MTNVKHLIKAIIIYLGVLTGSVISSVYFGADLADTIILGLFLVILIELLKINEKIKKPKNHAVFKRED